MKKVILHLCADIGSDSRFFDIDPDFEVIKVGADVGAAGADMFDGWGEGGFEFFHVVCDDESGALDKGMLTLDMPAPQWTRTPPLFRSV